jgi:TPR repeat protein
MSLQDTVSFCDSPDTMCLANFQLSRWDEEGSLRGVKSEETLLVPVDLGTSSRQGISQLKRLGKYTKNVFQHWNNLHQGNLVPKNLVEAAVWFQRAAD